MLPPSTCVGEIIRAGVRDPIPDEQRRRPYTRVFADGLETALETIVSTMLVVLRVGPTLTPLMLVAGAVGSSDARELQPPDARETRGAIRDAGCAIRDSG
jgi:hypothetical protein